MYLKVDPEVSHFWSRRHTRINHSVLSSELFFQLQMAASYGRHHFQGTELLNDIQGSTIFGVSLKRAVKCGPDGYSNDSGSGDAGTALTYVPLLIQPASQWRSILDHPHLQLASAPPPQPPPS